MECTEATLQPDHADGLDAETEHDTRVVVAVLALGAILQALLVAVTGSGYSRLVAVALALVAVNTALGPLLIVSGLIVVNFVVHLTHFTAAIPWRAAHIAVLAIYGVVVLTLAVIAVGQIRIRTALTVAAIAGGAIFFSEVILGAVLPVSMLGVVTTRWTGVPDRQMPRESPNAPYGQYRTQYSSNPDGYYERDNTPGAADPFFISYSLNALGCRGKDYAIPNLHDRRRVLVLGGSAAFGIGVREPDTLSAQLQVLLDGQTGNGTGYDVINCGVPGGGASELREFYEQVTSRYAPDVVLLVLTERDDISRMRQEQLGYTSTPGTLERLFYSARLLQWARHEGRRRFQPKEFTGELGTLAAVVERQGGKLAVLAFRTADLNPRWSELFVSLSAFGKDGEIPFNDLGMSLLKDHPANALTQSLDKAPNALAHRLAAQEMLRILQRERLVQ